MLQVKCLRVLQYFPVPDDPATNKALDAVLKRIITGMVPRSKMVMTVDQIAMHVGLTGFVCQLCCCVCMCVCACARGCMAPPSLRGKGIAAAGAACLSHSRACLFSHFWPMTQPVTACPDQYLPVCHHAMLSQLSAQ